MAMKKFWMILLAAVAMAAPAVAQSKGCSLEAALGLLDRTSVGFKSVQTDFEWDQFQKVVEEHDLQRGVMYFRRAGTSVDVSADIRTPAPGKKLLLKDGALQVFARKTQQVTNYDARKNQQNFESFLALGFGGPGKDLPKNFTVRCSGTETAMGVATYKLELVPKSNEARRMFPLITLWINQQTGMSVQQKLDQGEGDYRLAKYTHIEINQALPADAFVLKK